MIEIVPIDTPSLGNRSYLAHDGSVAVVIDPQRDIDRVLAEAEARGVRIIHVAETHIHNDYVTGGLALARTVGADYLVNGDDAVSFDRTPVRYGRVIASYRSRTLVDNVLGPDWLTTGDGARSRRRSGDRDPQRPTTQAGASIGKPRA